MTQPSAARRGLAGVMRRPIVVAPMAGGPTTPDLVIAAANAGARSATDQPAGEIIERLSASTAR